MAPETQTAHPASAKRPLQYCFVIGRPRSGTTVFKDMLNTHPALFSMGEVFNETNERSYFRFLQELIAADPRAALPSQALRNFGKYLEWCGEFARQRRPATRMLVLDVKYDQSHLLCEPWWSVNALPKVFSLIRERGWKVIDIHRKDVAGLVVSNQIAIKTKVYHSTNLEPGAVQRAKVHIDPQRLERELVATQNSYRRIAAHFGGYKKYLGVFYEDMFDDDGCFSRSLLERLSDFIGVENRFDPKPRLAKLLEKDIFSHIENADEIRSVIDGRAGT